MKRLALLVLLSSPAVASDWYVDPVGGSNGNSGLNRDDAWSSITFALSQVPAGDQTIHLLEGTYDAASGEQFPLELEDGITVRGVGNVRQTVVRTDGTAFEFDGGSSPKSATLSSFTIEGAEFGLRAVTFGQLLSPTATDMRFVDCTTGIFYGVAFQLVGGTHQLLVTGSTFQDCSLYGIGGSAQSFLPETVIVVEDSSFLHCGTGVLHFHSGDAVARGFVRRCRFRGNTAAAVNAASFATSITVEDSLITANANGILSDGFVTVVRSTVAENIGVGIQSSSPTIFGEVQSSIVHGNGDDLQGVAFPVRDSNIGDGDFVGIDGNISADPLFRDPANRDYRLSFGSPCIDAAPSSPGSDLLGFRRSIDGDLDTIVMDDMGALELATLRTRSDVGIDADFMIAVEGEVGAFAALFLDRNGPLGAPISTPFGPRWLDPNSQEYITTVQVDPSGTAQFLVTLPDDPSLVGLTIGFQALIRSTAAPAGVAFSSFSSSTVVAQ